MGSEDQAAVAERTSSEWAAAQVIFTGGSARFGDLVWDMADVVTSVNRSPGNYRIRFEAMPERWRLLARELLMCSVDGRTVRSRLGVQGWRRSGPRTLQAKFYRLRRVAKWADSKGKGLPATWTQQDCNAALRHVASGVSDRRLIEHYAELIKSLATFSGLLTDGGLTFSPWDGQGAPAVAKAMFPEMAQPADGCVTPVLDLDAFKAVMTAALAYVEVFSDDIIEAWRLRAARPSSDMPPSKGGPESIERVRAWLADGATVVPILSGTGAASAQRLHGYEADARTPNWNLVARHANVEARAFFRMHRSSVAREMRAMVMDAVEEGRVLLGVYEPKALIELPNGERRPWRPPWLDFRDLKSEVHALRIAGAIVMVALTGMRDSEFQDVRRDSRHTHLGTQALRTNRFKHRRGYEPVSWWVSDEVITAFEAMERVSAHPTHVFSSMSPVKGEIRPGARLPFADFVDRVNSTREFTNLPAIPQMDEFSPRVLRETFAYYLGRSHELGDIIVGLQFGHAKATMTASYQRYEADNKWNTAFRRGQVDADTAILDAVGSFTEPNAIVGVHAGELRDTAAAVRATVLTDPEAARRIAEHHADTWHHGTVLSCRFDRSSAICHKYALTAGIAINVDAPLHDLCVGPGCSNAHFTSRNLPALREQRDLLARKVAAVAIGSTARLQLEDELGRIEFVLARLDKEES